LVAFIILSSFFLYSLAFNPLVTSDDALNVLMAFDYQIPPDFYCWGQDRGGTIIPLISQFFIHVLNLSPILSVSLSNYLLLTLGFIGFSKLFKQPFTLMIFAVLWFFPYERFINILSFPIGMSYSLIGISIYFLDRLLHKKDLTNFSKHFHLLVSIGLWGLAIWTSDLAFFTVLLLVFTLLFYSKYQKTEHFPKKLFILYSTLGIAAVIFIILKLKTYATGVTENFQKFNSAEQIGESIRIVFSDCLKVLTFQEDNFLISIGAWLILVVLIILVVILALSRKSIFSFKNPWILFLISDFLAVLAIIFLAHWVLLNNMGRWYFVATYISGLLLVLFMLDSFVEKMGKFLKAICVSCVLILAITPIYTSLRANNWKYTPLRSTILELNKLGGIGIIGDYWDAYRCSIANPENIKSTPHEGEDIKNTDRISEVFRQPKIYLSKDMWFDSFPDSIQQFGVMLYKYSDEFFLGGSNLCAYKPKKLAKIYTLDDLKFDSTVLDKTSSSLKVYPEDKKHLNKHLVYGPDISLVPGTYRVRFFCASSGLPSASEPLTIDISSGFGQKSLFQKDIGHAELVQGKQYVTCTFTVENLEQHVEFRLLYSGFNPIEFKQLEVFQLK
jgi:hypothetical protein